MNIPENQLVKEYAIRGQAHDAEEVTDIVQAIGMAPGLSQVRVYIGYLDSEILNAIAAENIAKQISISWGWGPDDPSTADVFFQEMAAQGQSVFVASGDSGNYSPGAYPFPAEDAFVTAVGGTDLVTSGAGGPWSSETAWSWSGGGISPDGIAIPSWQAGVANSSNGGSTALRNVPDVAMEANIDNYYCDHGQCHVGWLGGTSLAAPRWAAFIALVNQQATEAGEPTVGFLNPAIYRIGAGANYANDLHDIASGSNNYSNLCKGAPACYSVPSYDLVTGWGSPTGQALIDELAPPSSAGFQIAASVTSLSINPGSSGTTTIAVTNQGQFNGSVTLMVSGLPGTVTASWGTNPTTGISVLTLSVASTAARGSYGVTITGTSGSLSATTNFTLEVNAPGFAIFPSPGALRLQQGSSTATTIEVVNYAGFSGNVNLAITSQLPKGVTASWGVNPTSSASMLTLSASDTAVLTESQNGLQTENIPITIAGSSGSLSAITMVTLSLVHSGIWGEVSPTFLPITQGTSGTATFTAVPFGKTHGPYSLSASQLPSGVTVSFNPASISAGETSQITVTTDATTPIGMGGLPIQAFPQYSGDDQSGSGLTLIVTATPQPSASVSISPLYVAIQQGSSTTLNISVNGQNGFTGPEYLRLLPPLPPGITASLSQNATSSTSILTLTASASAQPGLYYPYLCYSTDASACVSGSSTPSYTVRLWVQVQPAPGFSITSSAGSLSVVPAGSATSTISVAPQLGLTGNVQLSVGSTLPPGVVASFSPNSTSTNSVLTLTAGTSVSPGKYLVMIAGTSGSQTNTTAIELSVASATTTALSITPAAGGNSSSSRNSYTLIATVLSGSVPVAQGQVNFCDASSAYCTDSHLLGTAQLTRAGTATLKFHAAIGSHSYKAVFLGTPGGSPPFDTSTSSPSSLVVSGSTSTAIAATDAPGSYMLTATVAWSGSAKSPTGTVSFVDTSNGDAILGTASLEPGSGSLSFTNSSNSITGNGPQSVVTGDFNGDGILDLAVTNSLSNTVTILLGNGDGTFTATQNSPATRNKPSGIVTGDFNGDGILDLAIANTLSNTVTILLGNGDGTFAAAADRPNTGNSPTYIAVGDFNGDGKLDLAVVNSTGIQSSMTILLGNGDGTFTAQPDSPANGYYLGPVVVGDFNRDGNLDLAVEDEYSGTLMVLLGKGDGNFNFFWTMPNQVFTNHQNLVTGDFNGDGNLDLAVVNGGDKTVAILLGNGDGTFTVAPNNLATGNFPYSVALGDFNGDENLDLAVTNGGGNTVAIFLGNGNGTFTAAPNPPPNADCPSSISVGDWNGDGVPEMAVINGCENRLTVLTTSLTETAIASVDGVAVTGLGTHAVIATYPGDSLYGASVSGTTSLTGENPAEPPSFTLLASPASVSVAQGGSGSSTISVTDIGAFSGTVALAATGLPTGVTASFAAVSAAGTQLMTLTATDAAAVAGPVTLIVTGISGNLTASTTITLTITAEAAFAANGNDAPITVAPGATTGNTSAISVKGTNGFSGTVNLACSISPMAASDSATCTLSPSSLTLSGNTAQTSTLTVRTTARTSAANRRERLFWPAGGTALALLLFFTVPRRRIWLAILGLLVLMVSAGITACGGGGSLSGGGVGGNSGTTPGTYTVTVTGTSGTISPTVGTVTLTVQ